MNETSERVESVAASPVRRSTSWIWLPVAAGVATFAVNNLLLARLLTSLPGGTVLAPTTMAAAGFVAARRRRMGAVTLIFATYSALGILGHLGVDAGTYVTHIPRVLCAAIAFDGVVAAAGFRRWAPVAGLLPFAALLLFGAPVSAWAFALLLSGAGVGLGVLIGSRYGILQNELHAP